MQKFTSQQIKLMKKFIIYVELEIVVDGSSYWKDTIHFLESFHEWEEQAIIDCFLDLKESYESSYREFIELYNIEDEFQEVR